MSDQKLRIEIETAATGSGIPQTAAGLEKVGSAAQKAAPALQQASKGTMDLAQGLGQGAAVGNAAVAAISNLANASQGGASGLIALARAAFATGVSLKGLLASLGPFGIAAAAFAIALGLISTALGKSEAAAVEAKKKLDELNKAKLDKVTAEHTALAGEAGRAAAAIDAELAAMDRIADRRLARQIEEEKAKGLPADVEAANITRLRRNAEDAKLGREQSGLDRKAELAETVASDTARSEDTARIERDMFLALKARRDNAKVVAEEAFAKWWNIASNDPTGAASQEIVDRKDATAAELVAAQRAYESKLGGKDESGTLFASRLKTLEEALQKNTEAANAAQRAAEDARTKAENERKTQTELKPETDALRSAENKNTLPQSAAEKAKIEEARAKARAKMEQSMRTLGPDAVANRIAGGDSSLDIELARQLFPKRKFTPPSTASTPGTPGTGVYRPGEALPTNTTGVYRGGALPAGPVDPRNQLTFGKLQPGSDNKDADKVVDALKGATSAVQAQSTGDDAAKAAEELKKATESSAAARSAADSATQAALTQTANTTNQLVGAVDQLVSVMRHIQHQQRVMSGQISAMRSRIST